MIHKTAIIDSGAELASDVEVGPYTFIESDVTIGEGTVIGPNVNIKSYTSIGPRCHIHTGAVLGGTPQDLNFDGGKSYVTIGANCQIREGVTINRGTQPDSTTEIGDDCFLMALSHFGHNVKLGNKVIVANGALLGGYVEVGDQAFISGNCILHQFVTIGRLAMLGGGCGASKDVPPFCLMKPLEANKIIGLNSVGLRRSELSKDDRQEIKEAFKILFLSGLNIRPAVEKIKSAYPSGPAYELAIFIDESERGICVM
ncbi:acyl-(Acyl-carrier-protein)-UDP-N-acetylglucosamine O-acyltransferase [Candidatus Scalindua japonica]|uniref:Acyl-(Acyl-carrier-protein)-UDP-N-acetylglucosamine O-acyltransferase n=1 Tax=Candidatus Scalindua japonica TaxID=1284222 RepID=A0A286TY06_9BACT|nr:acyl-ACP--UDP-N-acetylglucosamine O-acyltransferase [Candidatus Scalindua japonica]GAX60756.1 acyl-(Acyl-carrier-protein)-UDP-N-acetylglucosamine O-acyltransferase [Candidatus Scalindua japonica]